MKISVSHPRLKTILKFTDSELKFLQLLEEDEYLEGFLLKSRKSIGIPQNGIDLNVNNFLGSIPTDDSSLQKVWRAASGFLWYYNLPPRWYSTAVSLVLFNIATPPDSQNHKPVSFSYTNHRFDISDTPEVQITVKEKMSREKLKRLVDEHKTEVDELLSRLPENPAMGRIKNIEIAKMMRQLKKSKGLTDEEIGNEIDKIMGYGYPTDYTSVKQLRSRLEKYLRTHIKTDRMR